MPNFSRNDVVLVRYPFSDGSEAKVRPAVVVSATHASVDVIIVPLTSRIWGLFEGEFVLADWSAAGLHVSTAVKRGLYSLDGALVIKRVGSLMAGDAVRLEASLKQWLGLS